MPVLGQININAQVNAQQQRPPPPRLRFRGRQGAARVRQAVASPWGGPPPQIIPGFFTPPTTGLRGTVDRFASRLTRAAGTAAMFRLIAQSGAFNFAVGRALGMVAAGAKLAGSPLMAAAITKVIAPVSIVAGGAGAISSSTGVPFISSLIQHGTGAGHRPTSEAISQVAQTPLAAIEAFGKGMSQAIRKATAQIRAGGRPTLEGRPAADVTTMMDLYAEIDRQRQMMRGKFDRDLGHETARQVIKAAGGR